MATRVIKLREAEEPAPDMVQEVLSQSKRPEVGRFLLQVDRQTKGSYATAEAAEKAGMVIKKGHPIVRVSVYDSVETANKIIELPAGRLRLPKAAGAMSAFLVQLLMARLYFFENGDVVGHSRGDHVLDHRGGTAGVGSAGVEAHLFTERALRPHLMCGTGGAEGCRLLLGLRSCRKTLQCIRVPALIARHSHATGSGSTLFLDCNNLKEIRKRTCPAKRLTRPVSRRLRCS